MFGRAKYNFTCRTFEQYKLDKKESGLLSLILTAIIFRGRPSWRYSILGSFTLQGNTKISLLSIKVFTSTLFNSASFRKKNSFLINIVFLTFFICQVVKTNLDFLLKKTLNLRVRKDSVRTWHRTQYSSTKKVIRWIFYEETFIWWENHTEHIIISLISDNSVTTQNKWFFQEKCLKVLKCYNFLWVRRRHNCSPATSFANCVMALYLLKDHLQTFLPIPITQKCQILSCDTLVPNERYDVSVEVIHRF